MKRVAVPALGTVGGEVEILGGKMTEWLISGNARVEALPQRVPPKVPARAGKVPYGVACGAEHGDPIRCPPDTDVASSPGAPCRNSEDREV